MRKMANLFFVFLIISIPQHIIYSQNPLAIKSHKNALVELKTGEFLNFKEIELDLQNKVAKGFKTTEHDVNLDFQNIYAIQAQRGHKGFGRGLIGAGIGLLGFSAILYGAGWDEIDSDVKTSTINATFFSMVGAGFAVGFVIGAKQKKHKRIFYDGRYLL